MLGHNALIYHGNQVKQTTLTDLKSAPIVITTYGMISLRKQEDRETKTTRMLHQVQWDRIIFDEAHHLKNGRTQITEGSKMLQSKIRWLVTGTPIQNCKGDFYQLCNVIGIPRSYYTDPKYFVDLIVNFVLKRTKQQIGLILPKLTEHKIDIDWTNDAERNLAEDIHSLLSFSGVNKETGNNVLSFVGKHTLGQLVRARQMCVYPPLIKRKIQHLISTGEFDNEYYQTTCNALESSSKIDNVIKKIVSQKNGKRKLIFCHFRGEIDVLEDNLSKHGYKVKTFDGRIGTKERERILMNDDCEVLILQIQTGCEGLNLQKFNEVYFVTPHWNPAIEDQAVARCHRIGQHEEINVFRFGMVGFDNETQNIEHYAETVQGIKRETMATINVAQ
jgi:SNF2 family DNA or RNA helicase